MAVTPIRSYDDQVEPHALIQRVQILDAAGNVLQTTTAPLPSGAATAARQDAAKVVLDGLLTELAQKLEPADLAALATDAKLATVLTQDRKIRRLLEEILLTLQNQTRILLARDEVT